MTAESLSVIQLPKRIVRISVTGFQRRKTPDQERPESGIPGPKRRSTHSSAMTDRPIVFLDSGIGGLPYLDWIAHRRPELPVSYVADTRYFPYGELESREVEAAVLETADRIFTELNPEMLVLACNTASVAALDGLRRVAPCPVVGTVPAVKPAARICGDSPIGVLATSGTVNSVYLDNLVNSFAPDREVIRQAAGNIVRYVEEFWLDDGDAGALPVVEPALSRLRAMGVRSLVIGCTHFLHVLKPIGDFMGEDVNLVDSRDGVGRRILHLYEEGRQQRPRSISEDTQPGENSFYVSLAGKSDQRYKRFADLYKLRWRGELS